MEEIWKDIKGYEGLYQISNLGNVKSFEFRNNRGIFKRELVLKFCERNGYYTVHLNKNAKRKSYQVHRLVAEAFIPNPHNKEVVNHIDFNPKNNRVENLEWCSQKENVLWSRHRMCKRRNIKTNTGERYIIFRKNKNIYRVIIDRKEYQTQKTLEDAIILRDEILKQKGVVL